MPGRWQGQVDATRHCRSTHTHGCSLGDAKWLVVWMCVADGQTGMLWNTRKY